MDNNLGGILKERRKEKGLGLRQLAILSGVSAAHIARVERGERFPAGRILRKLAEPLGFSEFELCKLAGFISRDATDDRLDRFKKSVKKEVIETLVSLCEKIDRL
ncbi:MAG: helix-turn-helix transcriptional regulator, partial [Candidatus Latescibacteria bacterium]|nr:helix-turn-helix transcriptional regulator [Candidatus Latescibacterota bacterium]